MIASLKQTRLESMRVAAASAVGAVTFLYAGWFHPALFEVGTVLLTVSLIPLAAGLRPRGGILLGLLFGVVWIAASFGMADRLHGRLSLTWVNLGALGAMTVVGGLSSGFLNSRFGIEDAAVSEGSAARRATQDPPTAPLAAGQVLALGLLQDELRRHREWLDEWDRKSEPWISFDQHLRELLGRLIGARRVRCYHLGRDGHLRPLNQSEPAQNTAPENEGLVAHVLTSKRRYLACSTATPPTVRKLAQSQDDCPAWMVPVCHLGTPIGLVTADRFHDGTDPERCDLAADLVEHLWEHVHEANELRLARLMDQASGLLNRAEFMGALADIIPRCRAAHEPVVILTVCLEGLRRLDDAGDWKIRDRVVETTGQAIRASLRRDDVVGRFSDALFVAVLRRLDVPLAELIAQKLMQHVEQAIGPLDLNHVLSLRGGLCGSGFDQVPLDALLERAFAALRAARTENRLLATAASRKPEAEGRA